MNINYCILIRVISSGMFSAVSNKATYLILDINLNTSSYTIQPQKCDSDTGYIKRYFKKNEFLFKAASALLQLFVASIFL